MAEDHRKLTSMSHSLLNRLLLSLTLLFIPLVAIAQSSSGYSFSGSQFCTLDDAGAVDCILGDGYERLKPPASLPALTHISAGEVHACGITMEGQAICWGENHHSQLDAPVIDGVFTQIDAGTNHTCALDSNGQAYCWGLNTNLQLDPPAGATFSQVDAQAIKSCGLLTDGSITCWSDDVRRSPAGLVGPFTKIDLRASVVCGLGVDGRIQCSDESEIEQSLRPTNITPPDNGPYIDIATSDNAVCGLLSDSTLDCALLNPEDAGEYPVGEQFSSIQSNETDIITTPREWIDGNYVVVTSGTAMCGKRMDGTLQCWDQGTSFSDPNDTFVLNSEFVASFELQLDARIYDSNTVEIFWTPLPFNGRGFSDTLQPIVEVFRNGELITSRRARFSFFDSNTPAEAEYQIRLVDEAGNSGPLSGILSVNTLEGTVLYNGEPTLTTSTREDLQDVFTSINSEGLVVGFVMSWEVNSDVESLIDGYEVRVNGATVGFTPSKLFVDVRTPQSGRCVEIFAVGFDRSVLGARAFGSGCN